MSGLDWLYIPNLIFWYFLDWGLSLWFALSEL